MKMLPVRPRPVHFEPLMGYMYRLARANGYPDAKILWSRIAKKDVPREKVLQLVVGLDSLPTFSAPAPRWLALPADNRNLSPPAFNKDEVRFCPLCLTERSHIRPYWSLYISAACFRHRCWLVAATSQAKGNYQERENESLPSQMALAITRIIEKSFGKRKPLRKLKLSMADESLSIQELSRLIHGLASLISRNLDESQKASNRYKLEAATEQLTQASSLLGNWPFTFWDFLEDRMASLPDSISIQEVFGDVSRVLYRDLKDEKFAFLRQGFEGYLSASWRGEINGRHRRFSPALAIQQSRISITKAERSLGVSDRKIRRMISSGEISSVRTSKLGKRKFTTLDVDELTKSINCQTKYLDLKAASVRLGLSEGRVRELITAGYLEAVTLPTETSDRRWKIAEKVVDTVIERLSQNRQNISESVDVVALSFALRYWRFNVDEWCALFYDIREGRIPFRCEGSFSLSKIEIDKALLSSWLKMRGQQAANFYDVETAAVVLHIKEEVVYQLVEKGKIASNVAVRRGRIYRGVDARDLSNFLSKYVSLAHLARERKTSPRYLKRKLRVDPVIGPEIDGCRQYFYLRKDIEEMEKKLTEFRYDIVRAALGL
jgi:AraC-like DNA-binding protein